MSFADGLRHRLRALFQRDAHRRALSDELDFHLDLAAMQHRHDGIPETAAHAAARRQLGNTAAIQESVHELTVPRVIDEVGRDARYSLRTLRRSPVFTAMSLVTLALGIGATATIFSVLFSILFAPLPVSRPDELVQAQVAGAGQPISQFRYGDFRSLRDARSPVDLAAFAGIISSIHLGSTDDYAGIDVVSGSFFQTLGLRPHLGRVIDANDEASIAPVAVLSSEFWHRMLNADREALGRTITIGTAAFTIVGVTPADYHGVGFPSNFQLAIPLAAASIVAPMQGGEAERMVTIVGRLRPTAVLANAAATLDSRFRACCASRPAATGTDPHLTLRSIAQGIPSTKQDIRAEYRRLLYTLMGGVVSLLLITCVNVANLLLSRAAMRQREFAVRLSLGASRARVIRQCLTESVVLSVLGGLLGVVVAFAMSHVLVTGLSSESTAMLGTLLRFHASWPVLAFTGGISIAAGIAFGVAPALSGTALEPGHALRGGARSSSHRIGGWLRRAFVVSQFAMTLLLVVLGGLFAHSLQNLRRDDLGLGTANAVIAFIDPRATPYRTRPLVPVYGALRTAAAVLPGVQRASLSSYTPLLGGANLRTSIQVSGYTPPPAQTLPQFDYVSSEFFAAFGLRFVTGRPFTAAEEQGSAHVAVVNEAFARRYFAGSSAVDHEFRFPEPVTIIGVVANVRFDGPGSDVDPMVFVPYTQWPGDWSYLALTVQTTGGAAPLGPPLKRLIDALAPGIRVPSVTTLQDQLDRSLERQRLVAGLATMFGALGLGLASVGLYGVVAYLVTARTGEFGVRLALGAHPKDLCRLVLRESFGLSGLGIIVGLPLALIGSRLVSNQLFGVGAVDPVATVAAILLLALVAVAASLIPARRAARVDPIQALRSD